MATDWNLSFAKFTERVLQKLGVLGIDEAPSAEDRQLAEDVINGSLKALHADGLVWWAVNSTATAWVGGATQAAPTGYVSLLEAYWLNGDYIPLRVLERGEYEALPDKTSTGVPEFIFDNHGTLTVWPVPGSGTVRLTYLRELADGDSNVSLDIPKALVKPMVDWMAYELAPWFGVNNHRIDADAVRAQEALRRLRPQVAQFGPVQAEYF